MNKEIGKLIELNELNIKILIQMKYEAGKREKGNFGLLVDNDECALIYQKLDKQYMRNRKKIDDLLELIK